MKNKMISVIAAMFSLALCVPRLSVAQYYYKDIISNRQLLLDMSRYKDNNIRTISIKSFDESGEESKGFYCVKKITKDYRGSELLTKADVAAPSVFISAFDKDGKLLSTNDSSAISVTAIKYSYDEKRRIRSIVSSIRSQDDDFQNEIIEEHIYTYNDADQPVSMIRVKNRRDSSSVLFANDENNNVGIEKDTKTGSKYFYYYDSKKRLSDIVQANEYSKNLKPDYMFEYNGAGNMSQMTAVEEGSSNYYVWKYSYDNGLRIREKCYTDERRLMGSIEYEYK